MSAETNGAMPATAFNENGPDGYYTTHYGYTKREEFARAAMQGVQLSLGVLGGSAPTNYEQVAHMAVMQADALLEELAKKDAMAANPTDDDFNQSPEDLAIWLDRKYARHGEDEDRQAAAMLRQYAALTAAQQQGQVCECPIPMDDPPDMHAPGCVVRQPKQQGGGDVLARGWLHRRGPGDDYDLHDESSGVGNHCANCVPCVILRADAAPPSAPEAQLTYKGVPIGPMQTFADIERQASAPVGVEGCLDRLRQHRSQRLWQADLVGGQISVERMRAILHVALAQQPAVVDGAWTDEQCAEFMSVAMRHCEVRGNFRWDDVRMGQLRANRLATQHQEPKP